MWRTIDNIKWDSVRLYSWLQELCHLSLIVIAKKRNIQCLKTDIVEESSAEPDMSGSSTLKHENAMSETAVEILAIPIPVRNSDDLEHRLAEAGEKLVMIYFKATWCWACKMTGPTVDDIATEFADDIVVLKVDIDECADSATAYNIEVLPTFVFVKNSRKLEVLSGAKCIKVRSTIAKLK